MTEMHKDVVLLALFDERGRLYMKRSVHPTEGYEVLDFAISSEKIDKNQEASDVATKLASQIGVVGGPLFAGEFTEHITKPIPSGENGNTLVHVRGLVYRAECAQSDKFNQADAAWKTEDELATDQRARRDRWLHPYLFSGEVFSVEADTDQTKSWIDAVTVVRSPG